MTQERNKDVSPTLLAADAIGRKILLIRNEKVLLDSDLAALYRVETKALTRTVKRNIDRFPEDSMFQLTEQEVNNLRSHFGASSSWGGRRTVPYVFTE